MGRYGGNSESIDERLCSFRCPTQRSPEGHRAKNVERFGHIPLGTGIVLAGCHNGGAPDFARSHIKLANSFERVQKGFARATWIAATTA